MATTSQPRQKRCGSTPTTTSCGLLSAQGNRICSQTMFHATALVIGSLHFRRKASERLKSSFIPVISTGRVVQEGLLAHHHHHHQGKQTIHFHQYMASESLAVDVLRMRRRREQSFLEEQQKGLVWVSGATECRPPVLENARAGKRCVVCTFSIHSLLPSISTCFANTRDRSHDCN